jgi:excisionase family DNA binding protein
MPKVTHTEEHSELLTVSEAARLIYVSTDTIRRYSDKGKLPTLRTPANHRRFRRSDVLGLLTEKVSA